MVKSVCVVGLGYIGLPTAAILACHGFKVVGVDTSQEVLETVKTGKAQFNEPGLNAIVRDAITTRALTLSAKPTPADVFIIAVPTPFHPGNIPNLDYVNAATAAIAEVIKPGNLLILESTSPVGTTEQIAEALEAQGVDTSSIHIAHCPERVLPGKILKELVENDRIVGGISPKAGKEVAAFYSQFVNGKVLITDARTAEMTKLTENSFRDVNIAFANELSILCDRFSINVWELIELANRHPRVNILKPSTGVGGHCIAVDPWFIVHAGQGDAKMIETARKVNDSKTEWVIERILKEVEFMSANGIKEPTVACLGLTFKPNVDDLRESPALEVLHALNSRGISTLAVEPNIATHPNIKLTSLQNALKEADLTVLLVGHDEFRQIDFSDRYLDFCGITHDH